MSYSFNTVGLIGRGDRRSRAIIQTLQTLKTLLAQTEITALFEEETAELLKDSTLKTISKKKLGKAVDLVIVVGGDGSLLNAARLVVDHGTPLLGINRGRLGFLTDIHPTHVEKKVLEVLKGNYIEEERFLLNAKRYDDDEECEDLGDALNDVVVMAAENPRLIEFETYIDDQFVCAQRADGLIIATPTGSTAYALSGGGPILDPTLDALVMVPMFPHTLSSRPIVVSGNSKISVMITKANRASAGISCDGQDRMPFPIYNRLQIEKKKKKLRLIHPREHHFYETLRSKLGWENR